MVFIFGEPRGIKPIDNGERKGINTHVYTSSEIARVARVAFNLAKKRSNKVTSCEKIKCDGGRAAMERRSTSCPRQGI